MESFGGYREGVAKSASPFREPKIMLDESSGIATDDDRNPAGIAHNKEYTIIPIVQGH